MLTLPNYSGQFNTMTMTVIIDLETSVLTWKHHHQLGTVQNNNYVSKFLVSYVKAEFREISNFHFKPKLSFLRENHNNDNLGEFSDIYDSNYI